MQLSGSNTIRSGICDAYFRLVHQDDLTMSTSKGDSVWRHFLETEFAVRSLSIIKIFRLPSLYNRLHLFNICRLRLCQVKTS